MDLTAVFTAAADTLSDAAIDVATVVIPVGAGLLAIQIGWRYLRKFVK